MPTSRQAATAGATRHILPAAHGGEAGMKVRWALLWSLMWPMWSLAQPQATAAAGCTTGAHRQFDFWIGLWTVTDAEGHLAGINRIEPGEGGCVLRETWTSARGGFSGTSLNWFGPDQRWHQSWVDSLGQTLQLTGGLRDGSMIMEGPPRQRITWTPIDAHTVRQRWEMSANDGKTWVVAFDGLYHRAGSDPAPAAAAGPGAPLLERLAGAWIGEGQWMREPVAVMFSVQPVLAGRFTELSWSSLGAAAVHGRFEGRAIYAREAPGRYRATWWDSQGNEHPILASELQGRTLEALWGESGRTRYTLLPDGDLEVIDSTRGKGGDWVEFGRSKLKRSAR